MSMTGCMTGPTAMSVTMSPAGAVMTHAGERHCPQSDRAEYQGEEVDVHRDIEANAQRQLPGRSIACQQPLVPNVPSVYIR